MAVGLARTGEITATKGRINQSNYNNFQVARMTDAPYQTNVHFVDSDALPTGVGEPGAQAGVGARTRRAVKARPARKHQAGPTSEAGRRAA